MTRHILTMSDAHIFVTINDITKLVHGQWPVFYKFATAGTMVGGRKDFWVSKCKSEQTAGGTKKLNVLLKTQIEVHCKIISSCVDYLLLSSELSE